MASTPRSGLPYFYATSLAKVLVGDQPCLRQPWLNGHFELDKRPRSAAFAQWKIDHTALLTQEVDRLKAEGWKTTVERYFRLTGETAIVGGKPDVIAQAEDKRPKIVDCKSGEARESDTVQVMIYMLAIPLAWKSPRMIFEGEIRYPHHRVEVKPNDATKFRPNIFALVRALAEPVKPEANPSESACRFCDASIEDCPERFEGEAAFAMTSEF